MNAAYQLILAGMAAIANMPVADLKVEGKMALHDATGTPEKVLLLRTEDEFIDLWTSLHGSTGRINGVTYSADPAPKVDFKKRMVLFVPVPQSERTGEYTAVANKNRVQLTYRAYPSSNINVAAAGGSYTLILLSRSSEIIFVDLMRDGKPVQIAKFAKSKD
jgi:hypothetical protein